VGLVVFRLGLQSPICHAGRLVQFRIPIDIL
jgi:hypothetical protein